MFQIFLIDNGYLVVSTVFRFAWLENEIFWVDDSPNKYNKQVKGSRLRADSSPQQLECLIHVAAKRSVASSVFEQIFSASPLSAKKKWPRVSPCCTFSTSTRRKYAFCSREMA
ncbi:MAG: hypothetical protein KDB03_20845 [Planctomycetales bacterium]|nr:hypothetical protein [Planctomycetales bacterium]